MGGPRLHVWYCIYLSQFVCQSSRPVVHPPQCSAVVCSREGIDRMISSTTQGEHYKRFQSGRRDFSFFVIYLLNSTLLTSSSTTAAARVWRSGIPVWFLNWVAWNTRRASPRRGSGASRPHAVVAACALPSHTRLRSRHVKLSNTPWLCFSAEARLTLTRQQSGMTVYSRSLGWNGQ